MSKPHDVSIKNQLLTFMKTPKGTFLLVLILLTIIPEITQEPRGGMVNAFIAVTTAVLLDWTWGRIEQRKRIALDGSVITGLIIAMVLGTDVPGYVAALAAAVGIAAKHIFKIRKKPVLNPAASGLLAVLYLFSSGQSWWGGKLIKCL